LVGGILDIMVVDANTHLGEMQRSVAKIIPHSY